MGYTLTEPFQTGTLLQRTPISPVLFQPMAHSHHMNERQLLPISHGATLTYLPYCRVTESFVLLLPPIQSFRSEWVSHTPPLYAYDCSPHLLASTHLHLSTVNSLWVYSCLFQFQSLLQLSHSIFYYHQTVYSFNYIVLHRSSCSTLHHSIWNKQYTS